MKDYCQTQNGDLDLSTGDIYPTESTAQHQRDSVGAVEYLLNEDKEGLLRRTRQVLAADGQKVRKVAYDTMNCKFQIDAAYEND